MSAKPDTDSKIEEKSVKVKDACKEFQLKSDELLASKLQNEEFFKRYQENKQNNLNARLNIEKSLQAAKNYQDKEVNEFLTNQRKSIQGLQSDELIALEIQNQFIREAEKERLNQQLRDQELAKLLQEKEILHDELNDRVNQRVTQNNTQINNQNATSIDPRNSASSKSSQSSFTSKTVSNNTASNDDDQTREQIRKLKEEEDLAYALYLQQQEEVKDKMDKQMWLKMKEQIEKNDERIARVLQEEEKKKMQKYANSKTSVQSRNGTTNRNENKNTNSQLFTNNRKPNNNEQEEIILTNSCKSLIINNKQEEIKESSLNSYLISQQPSSSSSYNTKNFQDNSKRFKSASNISNFNNNKSSFIDLEELDETNQFLIFNNNNNNNNNIKSNVNQNYYFSSSESSISLSPLTASSKTTLSPGSSSSTSSFGLIKNNNNNNDYNETTGSSNNSQSYLSLLSNNTNSNTIQFQNNFINKNINNNNNNNHTNHSNKSSLLTYQINNINPNNSKQLLESGPFEFNNNIFNINRKHSSEICNNNIHIKKAYNNNNRNSMLEMKCDYDEAMISYKNFSKFEQQSLISNNNNSNNNNYYPKKNNSGNGLGISNVKEPANHQANKNVPTRLQENYFASENNLLLFKSLNDCNNDERCNSSNSNSSSSHSSSDGCSGKNVTKNKTDFYDDDENDDHTKQGEFDLKILSKTNNIVAAIDPTYKKRLGSLSQTDKLLSKSKCEIDRKTAFSKCNNDYLSSTSSMFDTDTEIFLPVQGQKRGSVKSLKKKKSQSQCLQQ